MIARSVFFFFFSFLALTLTVVTVESHEDTLVKRDMDGKEYRGSTRRDNDTRPIFVLSAYVRASFVHRFFESLGFSANFLPSAPGRGKRGESTQSSIFRIKKVVSPLLPLFHSTSSSLLYFYSNERPYTKSRVTRPLASSLLLHAGSVFLLCARKARLLAG